MPCVESERLAKAYLNAVVEIERFGEIIESEPLLETIRGVWSACEEALIVYMTIGTSTAANHTVGSPLPGRCFLKQAEKSELLDLYKTAVSAHSTAVDDLKLAQGTTSREEYTRLWIYAEKVRANAEVASKEFYDHIAEPAIAPPLTPRNFLSNISLTVNVKPEP